MNFSFWEWDSRIKNIDFLIVGGGIVGMSSAYHLKCAFPDAHVAVMERDFFSAGASTKNAGFACFGSPTEMMDDLLHMGEEQTLRIMKRRYMGLEMLKQVIPGHAMDFVSDTGHELFRSSEGELWESVLDQLPELNRMVQDQLGFAPYTPVMNRWGFQDVVGAIQIHREGMIHSGKMMVAWEELCRSVGVSLLHGLLADGLTPDRQGVICRGQEIRPHNLVICTNGFAREWLPELDVEPWRNQVLVTNEVLDVPWQSSFHVRKGYLYFRNIGKRVLIGGGRDLFMYSEATSSLEVTSELRAYLEEELHSILGHTGFKVEHHWSGIMGLGPVKEPIIQEVQPHVYVAVRMGGMGVAIGTWLGQEVTHLIQQKSR